MPGLLGHGFQHKFCRSVQCATLQCRDGQQIIGIGKRIIRVLVQRRFTVGGIYFHRGFLDVLTAIKGVSIIEGQRFTDLFRWADSLNIRNGCGDRFRPVFICAHRTGHGVSILRCAQQSIVFRVGGGFCAAIRHRGVCAGGVVADIGDIYQRVDLPGHIAISNRSGCLAGQRDFRFGAAGRNVHILCVIPEQRVVPVSEARPLRNQDGGFLSLGDRHRHLAGSRCSTGSRAVIEQLAKRVQICPACAGREVLVCGIVDLRPQLYDHIRHPQDEQAFRAGGLHRDTCDGLVSRDHLRHKR